MNEKRNVSLIWVVVGLVAAVLCCTCFVVAAGLASYLVVSNATVPEAPQVPRIPDVFTTPSTTPVPVEASPVPPEAHAMLARLAEVEVPIADPRDLGIRLLGLGEVPEILQARADPIPLGTVQRFWASNVDTDEHFQLEAELIYASDHVYFWAERGLRLDREAVRSLVDTFEAQTYPTTRAFFGTEWTPGVDGDPHLYILYARGLGWSIAGYYSSNDQFSPLVHEFSNGHEMFYLSADNVSLSDPWTHGVLAHEFQHMIHWYQDRNEQSWMNEGFSELAAALNGFDTGGAAYMFVGNTDIPLTLWPSPPDSSHYGQAYAFLAYFLERFGPEATQALVAHDADGLYAIDAILAELGQTDPERGGPITADDVFLDWALSMLLQDSSARDGRYRLPADLSGLRPGITHSFSTCPGPLYSSDVHPYGIDYVRFDCSGDFTLTFEGATLAQVVPTDPPRGEYVFWSNRGDESDMTLTRAFDFRGVEAPIRLTFQTWFDIEENYDYLYLEVSQDNGASWTILRTPSGTEDDPTGNSYGWAYTGMSGGGNRAAWIEETVDLSPYAGREVLLRFEYVTDAAVNGEGFLLDEVSIDAIGYREDFEADAGGWEAAGFVRLYNRVPQSYRLALVEEGGETTVREIALDEYQRAEIELQLGGAVDRAYLIVISTTRPTWQPAPYRIGFAP